MPQLFTRLVAATFIVGLAFGLGQANATPRPTLIDLASQPSPVETIGYYRYPGFSSASEEGPNPWLLALSWH